MIHSKRVKFLSANIIAQLDTYSAREWKSMRPLRGMFYSNCDGIWVIYQNDTPLCVIGLHMHDMIGLGMEVYFMMCRGAAFSLKSLVRWLRRAFRHVTHK